MEEPRWVFKMMQVGIFHPPSFIGRHTQITLKAYVSGFIIEQRKSKKFKNINAKNVIFTFPMNEPILAKNINQFFSKSPIIL